MRAFHQFSQLWTRMVDGYDTVVGRLAYSNPEGFFGFGGNAPRLITTGQLLSNLTVSGRYHVPTPGIANSSGAPIGTRGLVDHQELGGGGTQAVQRYTLTGQQGNGTALPFPQEWVRHRAGGTWSAWIETTNKLSYQAAAVTNAAGQVTFTYPANMYTVRPFIAIGLHPPALQNVSYQVLTNTNTGSVIQVNESPLVDIGGEIVLGAPQPRSDVTVYLLTNPGT